MSGINLNYGVKLREEYKIIVDWVKEGSTVIDLGCGDGELLQLLRGKNVRGIGIDNDFQHVESCKKKGLEVYNCEIDEGDLSFNDRYDYAICNVTLQMVEYPEVLLKEMFRISKYQIISFPNFAKWQNRLELLFKGRMPRWMLCGYNWYDTGHIHQLSIKDFEDYIKDKTIIKKHFLPNRPFPNLLTHTAVYLCE